MILASFNGHVKVAELLLEKGVMQDNDGATHEVIIAVLLIDMDADVNLLNSMWQSALLLESSNGDSY